MFHALDASASRMSFSITRCDHRIWWDTREATHIS